MLSLGRASGLISGNSPDAPAMAGLFIEIYLNHYEEGMDIIDFDPIHISAGNFLKMLYTRPLDGNDLKVLMAEIEAKKNNIIMQR